MIQEMNASYFSLAQQMIKHDRAGAIRQLGLTEKTATAIEKLSPCQINNLARQNVLLCAFRFEEGSFLSMISTHNIAKAFRPDARMIQAPIIPKKSRLEKALLAENKDTIPSFG